jgi:hypothetical protein
VVSEGNRRLAADFGEYHRILSRPGQSPSERNCGGSRKEAAEFNTPPPQVAIASAPTGTVAVGMPVAGHPRTDPYLQGLLHGPATTMPELSGMQRRRRTVCKKVCKKGLTSEITRSIIGVALMSNRSRTCQI